jgi:hypothetical protein
LELRPKSLGRMDLLTALKGCVFDPYCNNSSSGAAAVRGRSVADLAAALQSSTYEIEQGLQKIQAYALPPRTTAADPIIRYCLLAEQALQECYEAIVAALAEVDGCEDYAGRNGVPTDDLVTEVVARMSDDEKFPGADLVIRHCLQQLRAKKQPSSSSAMTRLDVSKVRALSHTHAHFRRRLNFVIVVMAA